MPLIMIAKSAIIGSVAAVNMHSASVFLIELHSWTTCVCKSNIGNCAGLFMYFSFSAHPKACIELQ